MLDAFKTIDALISELKRLSFKLGSLSTQVGESEATLQEYIHTCEECTAAQLELRKLIQAALYLKRLPRGKEYVRLTKVVKRGKQEAGTKIAYEKTT